MTISGRLFTSTTYQEHRQMFKFFCGTAALLLTVSILPTLSVAAPPNSTTPIKYVVVIFQENNSFDHYFGTYPVATNPNGSPSLRRCRTPRP
jgi:phospholipase C